MRIASLLPAATQIVEDLGRSDDLVAVSHSCRPSKANLPQMTRSRVPLNLDAAETDARVKELLRRGEPLFELDEDLLLSLAPDILLSQSLCNVCAIDGSALAAVVQRLGGKTKLFEWSPTTLGDVMSGITQIGERINAPGAGSALTNQMRQHLSVIELDATMNGLHPSVVFLEWLDPLFCAGHWIPELVQTAGGRELLGRPGGRSREISPAELIAADPDVIIACCCGWSADRTQSELHRLASSAWWQKLRAVRLRHVCVIDAESAFTMPGPGLADDCQRLAGLFLDNAVATIS